MDDLLKPVKTVKKVQGNIEKFESLSLGENQSSAKENQRSKPNSSQPKRSIIEIDSTSVEVPLLTATKTRPNGPVTPLTASENNRQQTLKGHDSSAFLQQSYLKERPAPSLPDNAREILQSRPGHEDLRSVLEYLQCGIDGKHDFNIKVTSPQAAQILNVLVSVTIPDIWDSIKQRELSADEARIKRTTVACLSSVAGFGALLAQIKALSASKTNQAILSDTIMVLGNVLKGQKTVLDLLQDAQNLYSKERFRRMYWQEMTSLLAGSRILSTLAEAFEPVRADPSLQSYMWLASGAEYLEWLAKNITTAAQALNASEEESWTFLSQLVRRGSSLGHRGEYECSFVQRTKLTEQKTSLWQESTQNCYLVHELFGHLYIFS